MNLLSVSFFCLDDRLALIIVESGITFFFACDVCLFTICASNHFLRGSLLALYLIFQYSLPCLNNNIFKRFCASHPHFL